MHKPLFQFLCILLLLPASVYAASTAVLPLQQECIVIDTISPDFLPQPLVTESQFTEPFTPSNTEDEPLSSVADRLTALIKDSLFLKSQLGICVYDLTADVSVFDCGADQFLRPASTQKVVTAVAALDLLGGSYLYRTGLYIKGNIKRGILHGNIYLRGGMDPLFDGYDLSVLVGSLRTRGIKEVRGEVIFDRSFKDTLQLGQGWCWDDEATPLTPLLYGGEAGLEKVFLSALTEAEIAIPDTAGLGLVPQDAVLLAERTHPIGQILLPMMKDSENLFAESLFYQIAAAGGKRGTGRKEAAKHIGTLLKRLGIPDEAYRIADGSGLSLYNYITPRGLVALLRHAYTHHEIYRHLLPSLPLAGEDGTLRRRMKETTAHANVCAKTGSVTGVSTLAGYCTTANGHLLCFAIMNQGLYRAALGRQFQDRVCEILTSGEL